MTDSLCIFILKKKYSKSGDMESQITNAVADIYVQVTAI
jgi:hypothetical protein